MAQTAVTLDSNSVTAPSYRAPASTPDPVTTPSNSSSNNEANNNSSAPSTARVTLPAANTTNAGCLPGNKFSTATGNICVSLTPSASASFGQQVRTIAVSLGKGNSNNDVAILQRFLISQNKGIAAATLAKAGATAYFGVLTRAALAEFQAKVGISPALGNFGFITRAHLRANY